VLTVVLEVTATFIGVLCDETAHYKEANYNEAEVTNN
jgi:hypothetical protein